MGALVEASAPGASTGHRDRAVLVTITSCQYRAMASWILSQMAVNRRLSMWILARFRCISCESRARRWRSRLFPEFQGGPLVHELPAAHHAGVPMPLVPQIRAHELLTCEWCHLGGFAGVDERGYDARAGVCCPS